MEHQKGEDEGETHRHCDWEKTPNNPIPKLRQKRSHWHGIPTKKSGRGGCNREKQRITAREEGGGGQGGDFQIFSRRKKRREERIGEFNTTAAEGKDLEITSRKHRSGC